MPDKVQDHIAFDRSASVRRIDTDGHLFIDRVVLSAADVCPYRGSEIPGWEQLRLDPDRVYQMYREPKSLEAAAASLNGKPVLMVHQVINADDHPHEITVGAVGSDTRFEAPNLMGSLSIWDAEGVAAVESGDMRCVSSAYRYRPLMEPGTVNGVSFDGLMIVESFNHLALVPQGRVKAAVIGDAAVSLTLSPSTDTKGAPQWRSLSPARVPSPWGRSRFTSTPSWRPILPSTSRRS